MFCFVSSLSSRFKDTLLNNCDDNKIGGNFYNHAPTDPHESRDLRARCYWAFAGPNGKSKDFWYFPIRLKSRPHQNVLLFQISYIDLKMGFL